MKSLPSGVRSDYSTGAASVTSLASVLGLTKREIDAKIEDIIDFADIREFIDSPVQSYSSGMQVRLGFAVATSLTPDALPSNWTLIRGHSHCLAPRRGLL